MTRQSLIPNVHNNLVLTATALASGCLALFVLIKMRSVRKEKQLLHGTAAPPPKFLEDSKIDEEVSKLFQEHKDSLNGDSVVKIVRQLEFFYNLGSLPQEDFVELAKRLIESTLHRTKQDFQVPKVRFGRTEIQMPIITCGGMRLQQTWIPDFIPLLSPSPKKVLAGKSQENLKQVIRTCLRLGINHFETARFYGTSELQFVDALVSLIESGEVKREDIILQTKLPALKPRAIFEKFFSQSWAHFKKLEYIDLCTLHCISSNRQLACVLDDDPDMCYAAALQYQKEGKIRHIGFSTHGTAENIMKLICSNKFSFVNLHCHYFGSYHAQGTSDTQGGHGNLACVRKALEMDMGVFNISPFDKGGMLYRPSETCALATGDRLTPIAFASLHSWKTIGMHTISVGLARETDLDEVLEAAKMFASGQFDELSRAEERLQSIAEERLGSEWTQKGLLNLPNCYEKCTEGMAIGHILWLHNLLTAYGMYDFCKARYEMLEGCDKLWNKKKSFDENIEKMNSANPGRSYNADIDLTQALANHYNPELVVEKLRECHEWLSKDANVTPELKKRHEWGLAYDLSTWKIYPNDNATISSVLVDKLAIVRLLLHRFGIVKTGPSAESEARAKVFLEYLTKSEQRTITECRQ